MKKQMRRSTAYLCRGAMIAALYVVLTLLSAAIGLSSGVIQFRLSEMLCVLPVFTSAAAPGLTVGCLIANRVTGAPGRDVLFGSRQRGHRSSRAHICLRGGGRLAVYRRYRDDRRAGLLYGSW